MKCERCGSDTRMQVQAVISAPGELAHKFSKQNLRRKDVYLMGVLWETADFICTNDKCRMVLNGYGNYVSNLKKENEQLKAKCEDAALLLEALEHCSSTLLMTFEDDLYIEDHPWIGESYNLAMKVIDKVRGEE